MYNIPIEKGSYKFNGLLFIVIFSFSSFFFTILGSSFNRIREFELEKQHFEKFFRNFIIQDIKNNVLQSKTLIENYVNIFGQKYSGVAKQEENIIHFVKTLPTTIDHAQFFINCNNDIKILSKDYSKYLVQVEQFLLSIKNDYNGVYIFYSENILYIFVPVVKQNSVFLGYLVSLVEVNSVLKKLDTDDSKFYIRLLEAQDQNLIQNQKPVTVNTDLYTINNNLFALLVTREKISLKSLLQKKYYTVQNALTFKNSTVYYEVGFLTFTLKEKILKDILFHAIEIIILIMLYYYPPIHQNLVSKFSKKNLEEIIYKLKNINLNQSQILSLFVEEVKNHLNFILTGSEIIKDEVMGQTSKIYQRYAIAIHSNAKNILERSNKTLKENQLINGEFTISYSLHNISYLMQDVINNKKAQLRKKKIDFHFQDLEKKILILCDLQLLTKAFHDMIDIMIDATCYNEVFIRCSLVLQEQLIIQIENVTDIRHFPNGLNQSLESTNSFDMTLNIIKVILDAHNIQLEIKKMVNYSKMHVKIPKSNLLI